MAKSCLYGGGLPKWAVRGFRLRNLSLVLLGSLAMGPRLAARSLLLLGERLYQGEFLVSENGKFKMGINEAGEFEIIALNPDPSLKSLVPGWDGKTFWRATTILASTGHKLGSPGDFMAPFRDDHLAKIFGPPKLATPRGGAYVALTAA